MTKRQNRAKTGVIPVILAVLVLAWTIVHSFLGIDLVDTGYYLYQYLYPTSPNISYTGFLATAIGALWLRAFPALGLWGLNLLELLVEYLLCAIVYLALRGVFRKQSILLGLSFCMLAISTYVNVFNYHQLSMFFCTAMLCAMLTGLRHKNALWQLLAGALAFGAVASRLPSILCLLCVTCIAYWRLFVEGSARRIKWEILLFLMGFGITAAAAVLVLMRVGVAENIYNDIFRISNLSGTTSQGYGLNSQVGNLIGDTLHGVAAALAFLLSGALFAGAVDLAMRLRGASAWRARGSGARLMAVAAVEAAVVVVAAGTYCAFFKLGMAPNFTQVTSYSWFLYGFFFTVCAGETVRGIVAGLKAPPKPARRRRINRAAQDGAIGYMSLALILLCFVGSAARVKHAILGLWLIAPLIIDRLTDLFERRRDARMPGGLRVGALRAAAALMIVVFLVPFAWFLGYTNNFDDNNRLALNAKVNSDVLPFLTTTRREADALNELLTVLDAERQTGGRMMVVGNAVMVYALAGKEAYVRPWITGTTYMYAEFKSELEAAWNKYGQLPLIVEAKTDPYDGFAAADYYDLLRQTARSNARNKKVQLVKEFEAQNGYAVIFENDYFAVLKTDAAKRRISLFGA